MDINFKKSKNENGNIFSEALISFLKRRIDSFENLGLSLKTPEQIAIEIILRNK